MANQIALPLLGVYALCALLAYLLGSISFAIIFSWMFTRDDVRKYGSGNAGATNVLRSVGLWPGLLTFVFDFAKGAAAIYIANAVVSAAMIKHGVADPHAFGNIGMGIAGFFALVGHLHPLYFSFRGGKGVLTLGGIILMLSPVRFVCTLAAFLLGFLTTMTVSIGSCAAALAYPFITFAVCYFREHAIDPAVYPMSYVWIQTGMAAIYGALVLFKHRSNIGRIIKGVEPKITIHGKGKNTEPPATAENTAAGGSK